MKMFLHYDKKDKKKYLLSKLSIFILIVLMGMWAAHITKLKLPSLEEKLSWSIGLIIVIVIIVLAFINRIKLLFKFKSVGFLISFIVFLLLSVAIETLVWALGLITIPLLIDDIILSNYFSYLNHKKYWYIYKDVIISENK